MLNLCNEVFVTGRVPESWERTASKMLAEIPHAKATTDYRPIACIRLFYKLFAYLVLGRIEETLEAAQPEEQHGFRSGRRLQEHIVTANLVMQKLSAIGVPVWIVSLDLSKAFDRLAWKPLWQALQHHGVSDHMIWLIQRLYRNQHGVVIGEDVDSRQFPILAGVRQGCVLSARLFSAALEWAMADWRAKIQNNGISIGDGASNLTDLRFADDLLIFAYSQAEASEMLDMLVASLSSVGLVLNDKKTRVLTTEAQPPEKLVTQSGLILEVVPRDSSHKWLGSMLSAGGTSSRHHDITMHLQAASKAFYANRAHLCHKHVSIRDRLACFNATISPIACFAAEQRAAYDVDMRRYDVEFRRLVRQIVGPPAGTDWSLPWHQVLHNWNERVALFTEDADVAPWSRQCAMQYWNFASYVTTLPPTRWIRRVVAWTPEGCKHRGRQPYMWSESLEAFCRAKKLPDWTSLSQDDFGRNQQAFLEFYCRKAA